MATDFIFTEGVLSTMWHHGSEIYYEVNDPDEPSCDGQCCFSSCRTWMPGIYENKEMAAIANRDYSLNDLSRLQELVNQNSDVSKRYITLDMLRELEVQA